MRLRSKYFFVTLLFVFFQQFAIAQQCGYEGFGAYIVQVKDFDTDSLINGLQLKLVYDKNTAVKEIGMDKGYDDLLCAEPYYFWQTNNIKAVNCSLVSISRKPLSIAGNNYLCIVPIKNDVCALSHFAHHSSFLGSIRLLGDGESNDSEHEKNDEDLVPQYFLKVHITDVDGKKNGGIYDDAICKIPIASVIDICATEKNTNTEYVNKELQSKTLVIRLKKNSRDYKPIVLSKYFDNYLVPFYEAKLMGETVLNGNLIYIGLYSEQSGKNAQLIYPPASHDAEKIWDAKNYEVLNWRNDRVRQCKVFRVPSTNTSPNARRREAFMYYCLNPQNNLYHIDTLFNNKENVYYNDQTHQITATNYPIGDAANFIISYKLVNDNWEYLSTERIPHQNIEKNQSLVAMPYCIIEKPARKLPLQYFTDESLKSISDTFWIVNIGKADAELRQEFASNFSIPTKVPAGGLAPIVYRRSFFSDRNDSRSSSFGMVLQPIVDIAEMARIKYFNTTLEVSMEYSILRSDAKATSNDNKQFEMLYEGRDKYVVTTDDSGYVVSKGAQTSDGIKYSIWFDRDMQNGQFAPHQEMKIIHINLLNANIKNCNVTIINGWSVSADRIGEDRIFVNRMVRTIIVSNDTASIIIPIDFDRLEQETTINAYLLKPKETFIYQNKVKVPCDFKRENYIVKFEERYLASLKKGTSLNEIVLQNYFVDLKELFSKISYGNSKTKGYGNHFLLDLSACSNDEIQEIKRMLHNDENLKHLDFVLHDNTYSHCDNIVIIYNLQNFDLNNEQLRLINKLGFKLATTTLAPSHKQYNFLYESKIADRDFFEAYNKLNELLPAFQVSLNIYGMPVLDTMKE